MRTVGQEILYSHSELGCIGRECLSKLEKDRQCTYNVAFWRVRKLVLLWKAACIKYLCVCVCVRARACLRVGAQARGLVHARVSPCLSSMQRIRVVFCRHLWPPWLHRIFRHYLINGTIFGKRLWNIKCMF